jgi:hypothetical protein
MKTWQLFVLLAAIYAAPHFSRDYAKFAFACCSIVAMVCAVLGV